MIARLLRYRRADYGRLVNADEGELYKAVSVDDYALDREEGSGEVNISY